MTFKKGDRVRSRDGLVMRTGTVDSVTLPNPPWHDGGKPYVIPDGGGPPGYWHYAIIVCAHCGTELGPLAREHECPGVVRQRVA